MYQERHHVRCITIPCLVQSNNNDNNDDDDDDDDDDNNDDDDDNNDNNDVYVVMPICHSFVSSIMYMFNTNTNIKY